MRHLIFFGSDDVAVQKQKSFFLAYLVHCYPDFCAAVTMSPNTNFYKHVARFTKAFLDVETASFEIAQ
jgi:TorA maturation chaperone TorD